MKGCGKYSAGQLRETALFERLVRLSDHQGGATDLWVTLASARAMMRPLSGREMMMQDRMNATATTMLVCRYFSIAVPDDIDGGDADDVADADIDGGDADDTSDEDIDGGAGYEAPSGEPFAGDRVTVRGKAYNIRYIRNVDMRDEWFEITLESGVAV